MDQERFAAFVDAAVTAAETATRPAGVTLEEHRRNLVASVLAGFVAEIQAGQDDTAKPAYFVPGPYDIAMQFGAAAMASGRFESLGAAMAAGWCAIPEFYQARDQYLNEIAPAFFGVAAQIRAEAAE